MYGWRISNVNTITVHRSILFTNYKYLAVQVHLSVEFHV